MNAASLLQLLPWLSGPIAFLGMLVGTPLVIRLAHRKGWVAHPRAERWHREPTALMGGIAICGAALVAVFAAAWPQMPWLILGGAALMFCVGVIDDLREIGPAAKLVGQIAATGLLLFSGYAFAPSWPALLSIPATIFWVIGITNAMNLLDNMDGLAAGVAATAAISLAVFLGLSGDAGGVALAMGVAGAAGGFLLFNFNPARIFMGDGGSLFLGYCLAALALMAQAHAVASNQFAFYLASVSILAVPILDTTLVTITRMRSGRSVSQGGRDHTSHRLVQLGLSEKASVITLIGISLLFGAMALIFHFSDATLLVALTIFLVVGLAVFGVYLGDSGDSVPSDPAPPAKLKVLLVSILLGRYWKPTAAVLADLLLVAASFVVAYYLRFDDGVRPVQEEFIVDALPVVILVKLSAFYGFRLYRAIWRHAGTPELVRIIGATATASAFVWLVLGLVYGFQSVARGVIVIDWMITTFAVTGVRFGFRALRQYVSIQRRTGARVLLYGSGEEETLILRLLLHDEQLGLRPVGFVDEDPNRRGDTIFGLPVLGTPADLAEIFKRHQIQEVIVTRPLSQQRRDTLAGACSRASVNCRVLNFALGSLLLPPVQEGADHRMPAVEAQGERHAPITQAHRGQP